MIVDGAAGDRLVSLAEIAALAGVSRPAPDGWRRRNRDFPPSLRVEGREVFRLGEMLHWLEARTVPRNARTPGEADGTTYADRIRQRLTGGGESPGRAPDAGAAHRTAAPKDPDAQRRIDTLMAPVAERLRDPALGRGYLILLLAAVLLREKEPDHWTALRAGMSSRQDQEGGRHLLQRIGSAADAVLSAWRLPAHVESSLAFLRLEDGRDLDRILHVCDGVPTDDLRSWLHSYPSELSWHGDHLTPLDLASLMASLLVRASDEPQAKGFLEYYDPYTRAGELLAAAATQAADPSQLVLRGNAPSDEACALAALNLTLHAVSSRLDEYGPTPWDRLGWSPPRADYVLSNPPFGTRSIPADRRRRDGDWQFGPPPLGSDAFAWLQLCIESLTPTGRAVVVMPAGAAYSTGRREIGIRREMVEQGAVEAIVALPAQLFPGTAVATCLWLLRTPTAAADGVLFIDARRYGTLARGRRHLKPEEIKAIHRAYTAFRRNHNESRAYEKTSGFSRTIDITEIRARNYVLIDQDHQSTVPGLAIGAPIAEVQDRLSEARALAARAEAATDVVAPMPPAAIGRDGFASSALKHVPLGILCAIQAGPSYSRLTSQARSANGQVPVVLPRHLRNGRIEAVDGTHVPLDLAQRLERFTLAAGDLLCVRSGAMGQIAVIEEAQAGWLFSTNLLRLRPATPDTVDSAYLAAYLSLPSTTAWIKERSVRTVIATLRSDDLAELHIPLPPMSEQRRIVAAITALDARTRSYQHLVSASTHARTVIAEQLMNGEQVLP